jgi:hypothetical protein
MTRVLTCLGMVSVLLLTSFVTKVYAAEDFPTSDLGASPSVMGASGEFNKAKITVSDIPGQTGESVTYVDLTPSPCSVQNDTTCTGFSDITIPGIGVGHVLVTFHNYKANPTQIHIIEPVALLFISAALLFIPSVFSSTGGTLFSSGVQAGIDGFPSLFAPGDPAPQFTAPITTPVGDGQVTIQLL